MTPTRELWGKYSVQLQEYLEANHTQTVSEAYLQYITASCTPVEAAHVALMIVVVPASQAWIAWVPSQDDFVAIGLQGVWCFSVAYGILRMLRACSAPKTFRKSLEVGGALLGAIVYVLIGLVSRFAFNVLPVPLGQIAYSAGWSMFVYPPTIMMFMEPEARQDSVRWRAVWAAYMLHWGLMLLLCIGAPLCMAALAMLQEREVGQVFTLLLPWILRKAFEALGRRLFKDNHPELIPTTRLIAISFYEGYLSIVMMSTAGFTWYVIPLAIACDLVENFVYFVMIRHAALAQSKEIPTVTVTEAALQMKELFGVVARPEPRPKPTPKALDAVGPNSSSSSDCSRTEMARQGLLGLVASVLVKEIMEVVMPLQTLAAMSGMYLLNPEWNALCAGVGPEDFWHGIFVLLADVLLETLMLALVMETVRRTCKLEPWALLVRVIHHDLHTMGAVVTTGFLVNIGFQHTYHGSDLTLQFRWLREGAVWHGGMCWTFGEETPQQVCRESWHGG